MKKSDKEDELRDEYELKDLKNGVRGKYYKDYRAAHNLVLLDPEVADKFPDDKSVNDALKSLIAATHQAAE